MNRAVGSFWKFFMSLAAGHGLGRAFAFPTDQKYQRDAGADGGVGDVEGGKAEFVAATPLHEKIQKIHDRVARGQQAVGEVANDAAEDESERALSGECVGVEMMARKIQHEQRHQRDGGENGVVAGEQAPGRTGVVAVDEMKKSRDDDL